MMFALNIIVAALLGVCTVTGITVAAFWFLTGCGTNLRTELRLRATLRFIQGLALCGVVGAVIMQAFDLWIT